MIQLFKHFLKRYFDKKITMIGSSHFLNMKQNYINIKSLNELDYKVYSQNGEDGIIDYLISQLNIQKPKFIEIGVGDYTEANTRFLFERTSCEGLIVDIINNFETEVKKNLSIWKGNLQIVEKKIEPQNLISTLKDKNFYEKIDLFSLDIDGYDYWVLKELPKNFSKIIIAEFNPYFGSELQITVPYKKDFNRSNYHPSNLCFGASLKAIIKLLADKNFKFIGTNLFRNNAFFINEDYKDKLYIEIPSDDNLKLHTDAKFRESRDSKNRLNFIDPDKILSEIKDCEVVDLSESGEKLKKIKDLINLKE